MNNQRVTSIVAPLERATHTVGLWVERYFASLRLTQAEAHVLAYLARHAPCSINDLHRSFGHKRSTLTGLLDRLEQRGWLRREPHPTSRRMVLVQLTEAGRQVGEQVSAGLGDVDARIRARAGSGEVAAFLRVLQALEQELAHDR